MPKMIHLAFDLSFIHMEGRWRMPGSWPGCTFPSVDMYEEIARIAERGCLDMLFSGDGTGVPSTWRGSMDAAVHWGIGWPRQDMSPLFTAMARVTKHIGYGLTYASTFMHPYYIARLMNSLDNLTGGRIALNVITSTRRSDAANYGFDELMEHGRRYDRLEEFMDVCFKLWDGVEPDAMVWDHATGQVAHPGKIRAIHHNGEHFKVRGPLNTPPSPQGRPVVLQAGGSPRGIVACARVADHAFAEDRPLPLQVKQRADLDAALVAAGRDPSKVGAFFQTPLIVAATEKEAVAHRERLLTAIPKEAAGAYLAHNIGYDLSTLPERFRLSELRAEIVATGASPMGFVHELMYRHGDDAEMTREEFFEFGLLSATHYDHTDAGDAKQMADLLEERFEATGSRGGFMIGHPLSMPGDLADIVDLLVPELQRRGRFRTEYRGRTLKENLMEEEV
jgi:FMN-dependent oxidoreductase (nitrilotriacetate monooxygenase family)